jgi:hypothetical protein
MRKACVEPISFNSDGSIDEVEMTTQGAGPPLDATKKTEAEKACLLYGNVRVEDFSGNQEKLTGIHNDDRAVYKYIDFKKGVRSVSVRVKKTKSGGKIHIILDQVWKEKIADITIEPTKNDDWEILTFKVKETKGVHALWFRFFGEEDLFEIDWFKFNQ